MNLTYSKKSPNGAATSCTYLLVFDENDDSEKKAWTVAQQLAGQRKLKHVLIGLLLAIHSVQELTGRTLDLTEFMASFITGLVTGNFRATPKVTETTKPDELPSIFAGTDNHVRPEDARTAFATGMGNLLEDDDELWD